MTEDMLLVLAMSTDAFFAALSYSTGKIKIPAVSAFVISIISSAVLTASMLISAAAGAFIPESFCRTAGAVLLGVIGITGFCQNGLKSILRKHKGNGKVSFSCFNIGFVISVYLDETKADADRSKILSPKEAVALALALSVDSVSGGLGGGTFRRKYIKSVSTKLYIRINGSSRRRKARRRTEQKRARSFLGFRCVSYSVGGI